MRARNFIGSLCALAALVAGLAGPASAVPTELGATAVREFRFYCDFAQDLSCEEYSYDCSGRPVHVGYLDNWPFEAFVYRAGLDFDVSSIPDDASIINVEFLMYTRFKLGNPYGVQVRGMPQPIGSTPPEGFKCQEKFIQVYNGTMYAEHYNNLGEGYHTFELNAAGRTALKNSLPDDVFTLGLKVTDEISQAEGTFEISGAFEPHPNLLKVTWAQNGELKSARTQTPAEFTSWGMIKALY